MFGFWRRHKIHQERVGHEAEALIERYGEAAYGFARFRRIETLHRKRLAEHRFWCAVARAIARHTGREIGVDTASRYTSSSCGTNSPHGLIENDQNSVEAPPM
jgi:hypothetical protein